MTKEVFICAGTRTAIGRYGGTLSSVRPDDLAAHVISALIAKTNLDKSAPEEVIMGCANQAGEDNRNVARMASLLAGLPEHVPGITVNRLCSSGLDAVGYAARAIAAGEIDLAIAGGIESMSRAPFVMPKAESAFARQNAVYDTTIGWRFVNPLMEKQYGIDSMPETAENVAADYQISRADQDKYALNSQIRAAKAIESGRFAEEITPIMIPQRKAEPIEFSQDEHPRATSIEKLASLPTPFRKDGSVTAGNASGVNDGAAALLLANEAAIKSHGLKPIARIVGVNSAGVAPRIMGVGPVGAMKKLLARLALKIEDMDIIELNEAFASQVLASLREFSLPDDAPHVNPNGGAIALGHPLGMSGARLALTAALELQKQKKKYAMATMCVGVGQGTAMVLEAA